MSLDVYSKLRSLQFVISSPEISAVHLTALFVLDLSCIRREENPKLLNLTERFKLAGIPASAQLICAHR